MTLPWGGSTQAAGISCPPTVAFLAGSLLCPDPPRADGKSVCAGVSHIPGPAHRPQRSDPSEHSMAGPMTPVLLWYMGAQGTSHLGVGHRPLVCCKGSCVRDSVHTAADGMGHLSCTPGTGTSQAVVRKPVRPLCYMALSGTGFQGIRWITDPSHWANITEPALSPKNCFQTGGNVMMVSLELTTHTRVFRAKQLALGGSL